MKKFNLKLDGGDGAGARQQASMHGRIVADLRAVEAFISVPPHLRLLCLGIYVKVKVTGNSS